MRKLHVIIILTLSFCFNSFGQDQWTSFEYQTGNTGGSGLIGQYVYCFLNDNQNRLWIGTASGISIKSDSGWESMTTNEGLLVNEVGDMVMDDNNHIWISYGSYLAGISKYDGENFTHYSSSDYLTHNKVDDILKDSQGNIWFATYGGITKYDGENWYNFTVEDGLPIDQIMCLAEDHDHNLWIGTAGKGVWIFDGEKFSEKSWEDNSDDWVRNIFMDSNNKAWISANGVHVYDGSSWTTINPIKPGSNGLTWEVIEDHEGNLFFGNSSGVSLYRNNNWEYFTTEDGLPNNNNFSLYVDNQNLVYSGSERGYSTFNGEFWGTITTEGLINNQVNDIFKDSNNKIWFCTHGGISILDGNEWESFYQTPNGDEVEWVSKGLQDKNGNYWFTTVHGIYKYDNTNWTIYNYQTNDMFSGWGQDILEDNEGNLWFGTFNYLLKFDGVNWTHYNETYGFTSNYTEALYQDSDGILWIGTRNGISTWNGNEFTHHTIEDASFNEAAIYSFSKDANDNLIATTSEGLLILENNVWKRMEGSPYLWYLDSYQDKNDILWFATNNGLYKYDTDTFCSYLEEDGLIGNFVLQIYREEDNGTFWFGTENGVSKLVPDIIAEVSKNKSLNEDYSLKVESEGITKPFQFSIDGANFLKNDGLFGKLDPGDYTIYVTNAYDTLTINHTIGGEQTYIENLNTIDNYIYPNPNKGTIHVQGDQYTRIELFNLNGQKLISKTLVNENGIDISELKNDYYIVKLFSKDKSYQTKILKVN